LLQGALDLLERKRQVLAQKAVELLPRWEQARTEAYGRLSQAYGSFRVTRMRSTADELRQIVGGMPALLRVETRQQVLSGVPVYQACPEPMPLRPRFGLLGSTAELDRTIVLLRDATESLAGLAALEATLRSLVRALHKTSRQVRTLRDQLLPAYDVTIRHITETLEEQERSYLFQLKRLRQVPKP
jgi:V/A-type H+-transporting ATPase subunit D